VTTEQPSRQDHASSFGPAARTYDEIRPGYPAEAVDWLVPQTARRVLDVGAGTGKFTRLLQGEDREVIAVDPSAQMLEVLREKVPGVETLLGTAEKLPLPDESIDAVTVAQAWHWVDRERGPREVARVLKPGGTLGLVWNSRDERVDWVRELGAAMGSNEALTPDSPDDVELGAAFAPGEEFEHGWTQRLTRQGLLALVRTRSHFLVKGPSEQAAVLHAVEAVLARHPEAVRDGSVDLPYVTRAYRFRRG
jgi:SAM-dependent methyltransferase